MVNEKGMPSLADGTAGNAAGRGRTLWLDCQAGVAGDMLVAALIDAAEDSEAAERAVRATLAALPVEGFSLEVGRVSKAGLRGCDRAARHVEQLRERRIRREHRQRVWSRVPSFAHQSSAW